MKNRKFFIALLVFLALLLIGVGYAAVTKNMKIGGYANTISDSELTEEYFKVHFQDATFTNKSSNLPASFEGNNTVIYHDETVQSAVGTTKLTCEFDVSMTTKGSYVEYTNYIVNDSTYYKAALTPTVTLPSGMENFYKVTVTLEKTTLNAKSGATADSTLVTVRIEMIKTPVSDTEADTTVEITFTVTAKEKS